VLGHGDRDDKYTYIGTTKGVAETGDKSVQDQWEYKSLKVEAYAYVPDKHDGNEEGVSSYAQVDGNKLGTSDHADTDDEELVGTLSAVVTIENADMAAWVDQDGPTVTNFSAKINGESIVAETVKLYGSDCTVETTGSLLNPSDFDTTLDNRRSLCTATLISGDYSIEVPMGEINAEGMRYSAEAGVSVDAGSSLPITDPVDSTSTAHGADI
jgi:hypothetical protein